jgi:hypothetical protein
MRGDEEQMEEGGQYKKEQMRNSTKNVGRERKVFKYHSTYGGALNV